MGRKISFKDEFDNLRITEYNIGGSILGLKTKSYFVPSTNSNAKENVVEYDNGDVHYLSTF